MTRVIQMAVLRLKLLIAFIKPSTMLSTIQISWIKSNPDFLSVSEPSLETELKNIFQRNKSDKSTRHDCHLPYSRILSVLPHKGALFEIGIGTNNLDIPSNMGSRGVPGASLRSWRDTGRFSFIFGADVDKRILFREHGIDTYYVNQINHDTLMSLKQELNQKEKNFVLVIDDGLHTVESNLNS